MEKNIMLAFVSTVSQFSLKSPITYTIHGAPYVAIQTNESAVAYVERGLGEDSLAQIFLIVSNAVKTGKIPALPKPPPPPAPEPVELSRFEKIKRWFAETFGFAKPVETPPPIEVPPVEEPPAPTHLEFLEARLIKEFPHFADRFRELDYEDTGNSLEKNILQIAKIADAVTDYAKNFPDCEIKVHADMTGGFRHTSMLMLSIIQLLSYRGIKTGKILYSDPGQKIVYEANEIQRVSLLITGADEFVKFGSVNALLEYFGETPSAASELLSAMKNFSDAIKICRTDTIEKDLEDLSSKIELFRAKDSKDLKSELFGKIIATVEAEYGELIGGTATRFEIIRWCMRKEFWQQAMTLCTEWFPEEIVARGIFMPVNSIVQNLAKADGDAFGRSWQAQFVISYANPRLPESVPDDEPSKAEIDAFCKNIRAVLNMFSDESALMPNRYGELKDFLREFLKGYDNFRSCCAGRLKVNQFKRDFPHLSKGLQAIFEDVSKKPNYNKSFLQFMKSLTYDEIPALLGNMSAKTLLKIFNIDKEQIPREKRKAPSDRSKQLWANREKIYIEMLDNNVARSGLEDRQLALDLLHDFYEIRRKRNEINHANGNAEIAELQRMIESYLDRLEKLKKPTG